MAEINWNLLQPVDTGAQVQQGFNTGMAMVKQVQRNGALSAYLANPDDPHAYSALAYIDPGTAATIQNQRLVQRKLLLDQQDRERAVSLGQLATTDPSGARTKAVAAGDFDLADHFAKLDDDQRQKLAAFYKAAGPIAYQMRQINDPAQRKALLDSARPMLEATGVNPQAIDSFDVANDTALDGLIAANSTVDQLIDRGKITWHQQGEQPSFATDSMGRPVGTQNPYRQGAPAPTKATGGPHNNPGALRKPGSMEFQTFPTEQAGIAAQEAQLGRYFNRGLTTVGDIVETYAPRKSRGGDNTDEQVNNYVAYVSKRLGVNPGDVLDSAHVPQLAAAMREFETGHRAKTITAQHDEAGIRAAAQRAIARGADPAQVRARAAAHGVVL